MFPRPRGASGGGTHACHARRYGGRRGGSLRLVANATAHRFVLEFIHGHCGGIGRDSADDCARMKSAVDWAAVEVEEVETSERRQKRHATVLRAESGESHAKFFQTESAG